MWRWLTGIFALAIYVAASSSDRKASSVRGHLRRSHRRQPQNDSALARFSYFRWFKEICGRRPWNTNKDNVTGGGRRSTRRHHLFHLSADKTLNISDLNGRWTEEKGASSPPDFQKVDMAKWASRSIVDIHVIDGGHRFHYETSDGPYRVWNASATDGAPLAVHEHNGMRNTIKFENIDGQLVITTTYEFWPELLTKIPDGVGNVGVDTFWLSNEGKILNHRLKRPAGNSFRKKFTRKYTRYGDSKNQSPPAGTDGITVELLKKSQQ